MVGIADCRIIDLPADGADVFPRCFFEMDLPDGKSFRGMREIDRPFRLKVFVSQRRMGGKIDGGMVRDEIADAVQRLPCGGLVLEHHRKLVFVERLVRIGHVAVDHVEEAVAFHDDDVLPMVWPLALM